MKNAIVQIYVDLKKYENSDILPSFDSISEISIKLAKRYAEKVNADYFLLTEPKINFIHPTYERFTLFEDPFWTDTYNNVLYLDCDVFIYNTAPNIFQQYPDNTKFKVCTHWDEYRFGDTSAKFNAGVFMLNKSSKDIMLPHLKYRIDPPYKSHDNDALIDCVEKSNVPVEKMDVMFNAKNYEHAHFCHSWGGTKRKWPDSPHILKAKQEADDAVN
jgi:hypothetical protein